MLHIISRFLKYIIPIVAHILSNMQLIIFWISITLKITAQPILIYEQIINKFHVFLMDTTYVANEMSLLYVYLINDSHNYLKSCTTKVHVT